MKLRIFFIGISIFYGCQKHFDISEVYVFNNESSSNIIVNGLWYNTFDTIPNRRELFTIKKDSSIKIYSSSWQIQVYRRNDSEPFTHFPFPIISFDTISILFESKRKINYSFIALDDCSISNNIFCKASYTVKKMSDFEYSYTYTFTEEDYRNATPIVFGEVFVGSAWRCKEGAGLQEGLVYNELRFVSESQVEGWGQLEGEPEPELFFTATYSIDGETVIISEEGDRFTATLNETYTSLVTNIDNEGECIFIKQ